MLYGLTKGTQKWKEICRENRELFICPVCGNTILLCKYQIKNKQYCSIECMIKSGASKEYAKRASKIVAINAHRKSMQQKQEIAKLILSWCDDNKETVMSCPLNKVSTHFSKLIEVINEKYGIKDMRSLFPCFNVKNKKEFAIYLKNYVSNENIC